MVDKIQQDGPLVLCFDGSINLPQFPYANQQFGSRLDLKQQLDRMEPGPVLVHHRFFVAITIPAAQKALHGRGQMRIAFLERAIELRQKELVVADHAPDAQHDVAQGRAVPFAVNLGMLGEHLAKQGGTRPRQSGHADKFWNYHKLFQRRLSMSDANRSYPYCKIES